VISEKTKRFHRFLVVINFISDYARTEVHQIRVDEEASVLVVAEDCELGARPSSVVFYCSFC
jgi:hypothetical protein